MTTLYFAEQTHLHRDSDGNVRSDFGHARYDAWRAYLTGVDRVVLVVRVGNRVSDTGHLVEGPGVSVLAVPFYRGPMSFLRQYPKLRKFMTERLTDSSALYGSRTPNLMGPLVHRRSRKLGAIFIAQVIGDPEDVLKSGAAGQIGRMMAKSAKRAVAKQVSRADAVIYVTRRTLQAKYPSRRGALTLVRSNVELSPASFADRPRDYFEEPISGPIRLVAAGSQEQLYKGHGTLIEALRILKDRRIAVTATIIGDGRYHASLVELASSLGVSDEVDFVGHLSGAHLVREHIADSDIFVMPSLTEGLPRALIEAMASGIVSIGSRVGGIPELIDEEALFDAGQATQIANAVAGLAANPARMTELAARQWEQARVIRDSYSGPAILGAFLAELSSRGLAAGFGDHAAA